MKSKFDIKIFQIQKKDWTNAFHTNTLKYALFPNDNAVTSSIIQGWQYEWYMFDFLSRNQIDCEGKTIIDVGGNNGNFAVDFAHLVGDKGAVHSFEPQRLIYYQLCGNVFMNGLDNVYCHNVAIGHEEGVVNIDRPNYFSKEQVNFGAAAITKSNENSDTVIMKRLDDYTFKNVVFIKIDVQGFEPYVINGATQTINKHRPYLFIEFENHLLKEYGSSDEELKSKIEALDYVVLPFQEGIPYQSHSGKCLDYVGIPTEKFNEFKHFIP
jgi:FkbM family methyltransferase